jgi:hypothetical protein
MAQFSKEKNKLLRTKCVFSFSLQLLSETFLILRRNERNMIEMYIGLHAKYQFFLSDINETRIPLTIVKKYSNIKFHGDPSSVS